MKYYSDKLDKLFDSAEECSQAEKDYDTQIAEKKQHELQLKEERSTRAKEIDEARKALEAASKHYHELIHAFVKDFGSYHHSIIKHDLQDDPDLLDFFDNWLIWQLAAFATMECL